MGLNKLGIVPCEHYEQVPLNEYEVKSSLTSQGVGITSQFNLMHVYSQASLTVFNGVFSLVNMQYSGTSG